MSSAQDEWYAQVGDGVGDVAALVHSASNVDISWLELLGHEAGEPLLRHLPVATTQVQQAVQ
jgi:hypothetical protein